MKLLQWRRLFFDSEQKNTIANTRNLNYYELQNFHDMQKNNKIIIPIKLDSNLFCNAEQYFARCSLQQQSRLIRITAHR